MKLLWIVAMLTCFMLSGSFTAFGAEQKVDKETFQKQAEKTLEGFKQKIEDMKDKAADLKMETREKFDQEMTALKKKKKAADQKLEELKSATAESWDKLKVETDNTMKDLKEQYDKMMSRFRKE